MRVIEISEYGDSSVLEVRDINKPSLEKGQILVKVKAIGVNPFDWKVRSGIFADFFPITFPHILGSEVAGVVAEVSGDVTRFKAGDEVYGKALNAYAEYVVIDETQAHLKPDFLSFEEAASLPTSTQTAFYALVSVGQLVEGQKVLIHAGSGNVGLSAIQIAKYLGAHVTTTTSARNADLVKRFGADEVIDYRATRLEDVQDRFDLILDSIGDETQIKSWDLLTDRGLLVSLLSDESARFKDAGSATGKRFVFAVDVEGNYTGLLHRLIEDRHIKPLVDEVFDFADVAKANDKSESGRAVGKIILRL